VHHATVLAALMHGSETWYIYSVQVDRLQAYAMRHTHNHGYLLEGQVY